MRNAAAAITLGIAVHASADDPKVLFIGNSYTINTISADSSYSGDSTTADRHFDDNQTSTFEALADAAGISLATSQNIALPSASLAQHVGESNGGISGQNTILEQNSLAILTAVDWDVIVLQDFSTYPGRSVPGTDAYDSTVFNNIYSNALSPLADHLISQNIDADIVFFNTWARDTDSTDYSSSSFAFDDFDHMAGLTDQGYSNMANYLSTPSGQAVDGLGLTGKGLTNDVSVARVGQAFARVIQDPLFDATDYGFAAGTTAGDLLYEDDNTHPDLGGEFLAACVLFETIYHRSPAALLLDGSLSAADLMGLQQQAGAESNSFTDLDPGLALYLAEAAARMPGDMDLDGFVDQQDILGFVAALLSPDDYENTYGLSPLYRGDVNEDGLLNFDDIQPFADMLTPAEATLLYALVPEPTAAMLLSVMIGLLCCRRHRFDLKR